eukprot:jgi/Mesvir1/16025/Mv08321-RA.1
MLESSLNDRIRVRALPANDPHGPFGAFAGRDFGGRRDRGVRRRPGDWRAFGPQTQRVVAALVKDTTCVLVGKRYEDSRGNCVEKIPELKPRLGRPEEWLAQPDGPTSAPVFTRCVAIGRTIGLVPLRDFPSTPLAYMPSVDDLNECGLGRARHGSVILETETAADGSQWTPDLRCLSELSFDILRLFPEKDVDIMEGLGWGSFPTLDEIDPDCAGAASGGESTPDSPADTALVAAPPPPPEGARVGPWTYLLLADITDSSSQVVGPLKHSAPVSSFADAYGFPASPSTKRARGRRAPTPSSRPRRRPRPRLVPRPPLVPRPRSGPPPR